LAVSVQKLTVDDNCSGGSEQRAVPERQITECDPPSSQSNSVFISEISGESTAAADVIAAAVIAIACAKRRSQPTTNGLFNGFGPLLIPRLE